jgi:hypothetical protein
MAISELEFETADPPGHIKMPRADVSARGKARLWAAWRKASAHASYSCYNHYSMDRNVDKSSAVRPRKFLRRGFYLDIF